MLMITKIQVDEAQPICKPLGSLPFPLIEIEISDNLNTFFLQKSPNLAHNKRQDGKVEWLFLRVKVKQHFN
jgi:hypothetical protein